MLIFALVCIISTITANQECDYATWEPFGASPALYICYAFDKYDYSYKYEYRADDNMIVERMYDGRDCGGIGDIQWEAPASYVSNGGQNTGNPCASWALINTIETKTASGQTVKEEWGIYDDEGKGRLFGSNNNPNRADIWVGSYIYGECVEYFPGEIWIMHVSCTIMADGEDVLIWEWFSDASCSDMLPEKEWITIEDNSRNYHSSGTKDVWYARAIIEDTVYRQVRLKNGKRIERTSQDTVCYDPSFAAYSDVNHVDYNDFNDYNDYISPQKWTDSVSMDLMAVNILVSVASTLCVIGVCLTAYYFMAKTQKNDGYGRVHVQFDKEMHSDA